MIGAFSKWWLYHLKCWVEQNRLSSIHFLLLSHWAVIFHGAICKTKQQIPQNIAQYPVTNLISNKLVSKHKHWIKNLKIGIERVIQKRWHVKMLNIKPWFNHGITHSSCQRVCVCVHHMQKCAIRAWIHARGNVWKHIIIWCFKDKETWLSLQFLYS